MFVLTLLLAVDILYVVSTQVTNDIKSMGDSNIHVSCTVT